MTNDRHAAEDITQEALAIAWTKIKQFDPKTNFTAWTAAFVRNVALNHRRKTVRNKTVQTDDLNATPAIETQSADQLLGPAGSLRPDQPHFDDRVMSALTNLNDTARSCLLLRTIRDLDYDTISQLLEIPPGTAMSHVHRARQTLRQTLKHHPLRTGKQKA